MDSGWCQTSLEATALPYGELRCEHSPLYDNLRFGKTCKPLVSPVSSQQKFPAGTGQFSLSADLVPLWRSFICVYLPSPPAGARHQQKPGSGTGQISLASCTRVCCQDKQVCSCCYGDKLGPKACFKRFFPVFARETEQLMEEVNSLPH